MDRKFRYPNVDHSVTVQPVGESSSSLHMDERRSRHDSDRDRHKKETVIELSDIADLSAKLEKRNKEHEMKEALKHLSRTSAELLTARSYEELQRPLKRARSSGEQLLGEQTVPASLQVTLEPVNKRTKSEATAAPQVAVESPPPPAMSPKVTVTASSASIKAALAAEDLIAKERVKSPPPPPSPAETKSAKQAPSPATKEAAQEPELVAEKSSKVISPAKEESSAAAASKIDDSNKDLASSSSEAASSQSAKADTSSKTSSSESGSAAAEEDGKTAGGKGKKARCPKRLPIEPPAERKNLRSSAGRQARAAAERQAQEQQLQNQEGHDGESSTD